MVCATKSNPKLRIVVRNRCAFGVSINIVLGEADPPQRQDTRRWNAISERVVKTNAFRLGGTPQLTSSSERPFMERRFKTAVVLGSAIANRRSLFEVEAPRSSVQGVNLYESDTRRAVYAPHDRGVVCRGKQGDDG
jgi:hypothetical protein